MKQIFIISSNFYDIANSKFTIGGIQTYIKDLCIAINRNGHEASLVQFGEYKMESEQISDDCRIIFYPRKKKLLQTADQYTFDCFYKSNNKNDSLFIIDTDQRDIKSKADNVVQIQHGITFDIPGNMIPGFFGKFVFFQRVNKLIRCRRNASRLFHVRKTVCVDYNYYNWFRTQDTIPNDRDVKVIPNYSGSFISIDELESKLRDNCHPTKIVFARRFVEYRGTRLMIEAVKKVLSNHNNIEVTFAGSGPLSGEIESAFHGDNRVIITRYDSNESVSFHYKFDIAVVPTIFSEGTSLSLCEAMAAGCIPVASCVGGMSNILLNGYNGLMIHPNEEELATALETVIAMPHEQKAQIAKRAYDTAVVSFSKQRWERQWLNFLNIK